METTKRKPRKRMILKKDGSAKLKSGRQAKYDEPTETVAFRMPGSFKKFLVAKFGNQLGDRVTTALMRNYAEDYKYFKETDGKLIQKEKWQRPPAIYSNNKPAANGSNRPGSPNP